MNELERFVVVSIILYFLGLTGMVVFLGFRRLPAFFDKYSKQQQAAMSYLAALVFIVVCWVVMFFFVSRAALLMSYYFCFAGPLSFIVIQYRFRQGKLKKSIFSRHTEFDERDYRIGQDAIQISYMSFWIIVMAAGIAFYLMAALQIELSPVTSLISLSAMALAVSLVHAISVLILYRRDSRETETASDG